MLQRLHIEAGILGGTLNSAYIKAKALPFLFEIPHRLKGI